MVKCEICGNEYNNARLEACPLCAAKTLSDRQDYSGNRTSRPSSDHYGGPAALSQNTPTQDSLAEEYGLVDNTFAWLLAVAPFVIYLLGYWLTNAFGLSLPLLLEVALAISINTLIVKLDELRLANAGVEISSWWGGFLVPVYLWKRNINAGVTQGNLGVWTLTFVITLVLPVASPAPDLTYQQPAPSGNYQPTRPSGHNEQRCYREWVPNPNYSQYDLSPGTWEDKCRWYWVRD